MDSLALTKRILRDALSLGSRAEALSVESPLLGGMPEFDSLAVVTIVGMIEDELGISIDDDELSAEVFSTVGTLAEFVLRKGAA